MTSQVRTNDKTLMRFYISESVLKSKRKALLENSALKFVHNHKTKKYFGILELKHLRINYDTFSKKNIRSSSNVSINY